MKIDVYKNEDEAKFYISFLYDENPGQESSAEFSCGLNDLKILNEKITNVLKSVEVKESKVIWNPRSQRHENVNL